MAENIAIWPGSASFYPGDTPFGFFDNDNTFALAAEQTAVYCARRLGYPIVKVEMQDINFFTAFEEAVTEYSNQVNTYAARDNIIHLLGFPTSSVNYAEVNVQPNLRSMFRLAKQYGSEAGVGGLLTYYTGSILTSPDKQIYDLLTDASIETGNFNTDQFTIRRIYHDVPPAIARYFDPNLGTGISSQNFLEQFGFGGMSPAINFTMMPVWYDTLRMQAIEFNDYIRKSGYSFNLTHNRLRLYPIPTTEFRVWFTYTLDSDTLPGGANDDNSTAIGTGNITGHSNAPYYNITYAHINDIGRQWIRKYALASSKEILGWIRGKYTAIPTPGSEVTMNGAELISAAQTEKEALITELRETLDSYSRQSQMERSNAETEMLAKKLAGVPLKIYVR